jgi:hypothetical protein
VVVYSPNEEITSKPKRPTKKGAQQNSGNGATASTAEGTGSATGEPANVFTLGQLDLIGGTVITGDATWTFSKNTLDSALALAPGVVASNSGGSRNEQLVFVRGFDRFQVPLSIDGIRVYLPADNRIDFARFLTPDISEVQIAKGYTSVLNGPGGLGGAINLVTKKPTKAVEGDPISIQRYWDWPYWDIESVYWLSHTKVGDASFVETKAYYNTFKNDLFSYDDAAQTMQALPKAFRSYYDDWAAGVSIEALPPRGSAWQNALVYAHHAQLHDGGDEFGSSKGGWRRRPPSSLPMARLRFTDGLRALGAGLALIVCCAGAHAEDAAGCKALAWPLDQERAAFASDKLESVGSGAARGPWKEQTLALKLAPQESVDFAAPTGGKRKLGKVFGGTLSFDAPAQAERYYVTLSSEGWIDVVQNGAGIKSDAHTSAKDCPGLRKSVRFPVGAFPVVLQLSGIPHDTIKIGIRPAQ